MYDDNDDEVDVDMKRMDAELKVRLFIWIDYTEFCIVSLRIVRCKYSTILVLYPYDRRSSAFLVHELLFDFGLIIVHVFTKCMNFVLNSGVLSRL